MIIDVSRWKLVGQTANTKYYDVEEDVIAGVPDDGARDDGATARENTDFQHAHWRKVGHPGVNVVFFDRMVSQNKDARRIYQNEVDPAWVLGSCLVGGTALSRAMISFSLGFGRPRVKVKMARDLDEALSWARELRRAAKENRT